MQSELRILSSVTLTALARSQVFKIAQVSSNATAGAPAEARKDHLACGDEGPHKAKIVGALKLAPRGACLHCVALAVSETTRDHD